MHLVCILLIKFHPAAVWCRVSESALRTPRLNFVRVTSPRSTQKRPDVHKIVLSIRLRFPSLVREKVSILRIFYRFVQFFLILGASGGGGGCLQPNFADKNLMDRKTFHVPRCNSAFCDHDCDRNFDRAIWCTEVQTLLLLPLPVALPS